MKNPLTLLAFFSIGTLLFSITPGTTAAQSTYSRLYSILQSNCTASGCHGASDTQVFDVSGSQTDVYNALVEVNATNEVAAAKGQKLVDAGYPQRSFLLRKVANGISPELALESGEDAPCPKNASALTNVEIELIRQWIMFGASQSGQAVSEQILIDYYNGKALAEIQAPPAPPAGQGFQLHDGPIFLAPGEEKEFQWKYHTGLISAMEVKRVEALLSPQSHHYIVYKYNPGSGNNVQEGHKQITNVAGQADVQFNASMIATWQYNRSHELPEGTAYFWEAGADLSSNFHIRNYDNDSVLAGHAYLNVYTQPQGSGAVQMFSTLAVYGGFNPFALNIPNTGTDHVLSFEQTKPETWHIWILQAHTHKLGRDYDIFLRNSDGTKGGQVYEGFFNYEQNFNMGFYDFAHPPVREFSSMMEVNMNNGLTHEATFNNSGPSDVGFGLTTSDEMFITYMHYTKQLPTAVHDVKENTLPISIYPNPSNGQFTVNYNLTESGNLKMELFNMLGESIAVVKNETRTKGNHHEQISCSNMSPGIYFLRLRTSDFSGTTKFIVE